MFLFKKNKFLKTLILISGISTLLVSCSAPRPENLGPSDSYPFLQECPDSPNCIVTHAFEDESKNYMPPLNFQGDKENSKRILLRIIETTPGMEIIEKSENYLHVEVTSRIFRFIDDLEFYFDEQEELIHYRSASRVGRSDRGSNSKRVERIRFRYYQRS